MKRILTIASGKKHISNLVLVEERLGPSLRGIHSEKVQIVLQHTRILKNINSAVDEILYLRIMPAKVPAPQIKVQDISLRRVCFQIGDNARRISLLDRSANLRLARPIVCHRRKQ